MGGGTPLATELAMPQMGYDMKEGTVVRWLKSEGAHIELGEAIAEIETDKAVIEFESYVAGVLHHIVVSEGTTVAVGEVIAIVGSEDEAPENPSVSEFAPIEEAGTDSAPAAIPLEAPAQLDQADVRSSAQLTDGERLFATPAARKIAQEQGVDIAGMLGTGPGGRIVKQDVLEHLKRASIDPADVVPVADPPTISEAAVSPETSASALPLTETRELAPLSRMRQQIARVTARSKAEKPHFYVAIDIDMGRAIALRKDINEALSEDGLRVTVNDLIVKACADALKKFPKFNAYYQDDGIKVNEAINIGLAVATEEGLIVPAILNCGGKSLKEIAKASKELSGRAFKGALNSQEYSGGTFTISNLGMFGISSFSAIIQPPQTAVLAVGAVLKHATVRDDQVVVSEIMTATLSADHRIVDGAEGAQFVNEIKQLLESPLNMML